MELGLEFDDGDFTEKVRQTETLTSYNAKVCHPEWFFSDRADNGRNDMATVYKFRGDYHFQRENHKSAIHCYKNSLDRLGEHNRTMRRELMESLARSHMKTGEFQASQKYVENVFIDCLTPENYCQTFLLQQQLYNNSRDILNELGVLQKLITLHPVNAQIWLKLVHVYEKISQSLKLQEDNSKNDTNDETKKFANVSKDNENEEITKNSKELSCEKCAMNAKRCEENHVCTSYDSLKQSNTQDTRVDLIGPHDNLKESKDDSGETSVASLQEAKENVTNHIDIASLRRSITEYPIDLMLLTCYIRVRLILSCVQGTVGSFIKDKNVQLVAEMNSKIEDLNVEEKVMEIVTQYINRDMFEDETDFADNKTDSNQDVKATMDNLITADKFNKRWFSWIKEIP
ncbi:uncharacterized protein C8orf76-like [Ruditapes philippinarum]|uniref:uncharacterized protein C8orf76-like n=1 Tax=Ruditapes philippinarum TaxID=129788 RepID=UPI00295AA0A2|nr:uncharacterized protein C8orf76-like [Ruditapes philippinarum]XP_060583189.1 uncharacterized protein C8orf76-like [Ruditapes philippinarum]